MITSSAWDPKEEIPSPSVTVRFRHLVFSVAFAPDEKSLFVGGGDGGEEPGILKRYDTGACEINEFSGHPSTVFAVAITSNGKKLVSGSEDKTIIIWDVESGEKIKILKGHSSSVRSVAITPQPDESMICSGSEDNTAKLWRMETGELLYTFQGHKSYVTSVAIHPSGEYVATGSFDGQWNLWSLKRYDEDSTLKPRLLHYNPGERDPGREATIWEGA